MDLEMKEKLEKYMVSRANQREQAAIERFSRLSESEQNLVKDAAVMGFFLGRLAHDRPFPKDRAILMDVLVTATAYPDLYPHLAEYTPAEEEDED